MIGYRAYKIKAFSVLEAVFSMVITAIIIGIVFVIFSILSERMLDFKNQNQVISDLNRLTYVINKDLFENEEIVLKNDELLLQSYSGEKVRYLINENYLLRTKNDFKDTFNISNTKIIVDTLENSNKTVVFQRMVFEIFVNEKINKLSFYKKIYSNQLIKSLK
ncbi:hypothetical protein [Flavobacterium capsici]|uniref:Uncharacterized protein n=1 Tax=Flavobacterium capsici TaxID=3075618 RepID=A0AA96EY66_9FLAO|nr:MULTISPECIES: hypothetical protein [unclassified Flavobacterium]WNM19464.1 hypothetical protein RN608_01995 [Flavobacterium sp. PMR2A8]WNM20853.1 hypothetical protein RN605_09165 [Flavobacterium sp. PMTSA4]